MSQSILGKILKIIQSQILLIYDWSQKDDNLKRVINQVNNQKEIEFL